jgi:hypothetical protein
MITEDQLEQQALRWFQETGWSHANGADIAPEGAVAERADFRTVILKGRLAAAARKFSPKLPSSAVEEVVHIVATRTHPSLAQNNRAFHKLLMDGVKIEFTNAKGVKETDHAQLIDFHNPENNDFLVVNQFTVTGTKTTWRQGILFCGGGMQEYLELARNHRRIAKNLLEGALASGEPRDYAYPVLFAYRHTLELYLKIVGEIDEPTHSLEKCVRLVEKRHGQKIGPRVRGWILEFDKIDPGGTAFRYADVLGCVEYWLDFLQFKFAMKQVFEMLDSVILRSGVNGKPAKKYT